MPTPWLRRHTWKYNQDSTVVASIESEDDKYRRGRGFLGLTGLSGYVAGKGAVGE